MLGRNALLLKANAIIRRRRQLLESGWKYTIREELVKSVKDPGRTLKLTLIFFRSIGCRFSRQGECTMCDYQIAEHVTMDRILHLVQEALGKKQHYEILFVAPLGSMFDPYEVPPEARSRVFELAAATNCIDFGTETRPEFLTEEAVSEFATILKDKEKRINIGLESSDPWILHNCIGKSFSPDHFQIVSGLLQQNGIHPVANILLGAPFLTEREALVSTVRSVRWALENGAYFCVLFPSNVKRWTLQHWLWEHDLYHSPSLWSLIEVIYSLGPELSQKVALSYYDRNLQNRIVEIPSTCYICHDDVVKTLRIYSARGDSSLIESLRQSPCACRDAWKAKILTQPSLPLYDRVVQLYQRIACDLLGPHWWDQRKDGILAQLAEDYDSTQLEQSEIWSLE